MALSSKVFQADEYVTGAYHPTKLDNINRAFLESHTPSGIHDMSEKHAIAGGTADAITATFSPAWDADDVQDGQEVFVVAKYANATTTPTFSPNGITAWTIVKNINTALAVGDIPGDGFVMHLKRRNAISKWLLMNPYNISGNAATATTATTATSAGVATGGITPNHQGAGGGSGTANGGWLAIIATPEFTVTAGDVLMVTGQATVAKKHNNGIAGIRVSKNSGTATGYFGYNASTIPQTSELSENYTTEASVAGYFYVTGSGTILFGLDGYSSNEDAEISAAEVSAIYLRKQ